MLSPGGTRWYVSNGDDDAVGSEVDATLAKEKSVEEAREEEEGRLDRRLLMSWLLPSLCTLSLWKLSVRMSVSLLSSSVSKSRLCGSTATSDPPACCCCGPSSLPPPSVFCSG